MPSRRPLPGTPEVVAVSAVLAGLIYSRAIFLSFYQLPSWLMYLHMGQMLRIYADTLAVSLVETGILLAAVLSTEFITRNRRLPRRFGSSLLPCVAAQ